MMSEPKIEAEKGAFRFPALVSLAPKRRFKASGTPSPEPSEVLLLPIAPAAPHHRRLRKSGHLSLRSSTRQSGFVLAEVKTERPAGSECPAY